LLILGKITGIKVIKLYDIVPETLDAIKAIIPDAKVTVSIPNGKIATVAASVSGAVSIIQSLTTYSTIVTHIAVSNEPDANFSADQLTTLLLPAIKNVRQALAQLNLNIRVTIPFTTGIISNSYPPSAGQLSTTLSTQLKSLLQVIADDGSYIELNVRGTI